MIAIWTSPASLNARRSVSLHAMNRCTATLNIIAQERGIEELLGAVDCSLCSLAHQLLKLSGWIDTCLLSTELDLQVAAGVTISPVYWTSCA